MTVKHHLRNFFSPTKMLDTGYVDRYNALPQGKAGSDALFTGSLMQYVANRFTRGSIRGQLFALLSQSAIADRYRKSSKIKWY